MNLSSWFLGFFEADGCFSYTTNGARGITPFLYVGQQADMDYMPPGIRLVSILLGGNTNRVQPKSEYRGYETKYKLQWKAWGRSKDILLETVWFFDQHPLISARKQRDYEIWRKMALLYITNGRSNAQLPALAAKLSSDGRTKYIA